MIDGAAEIDSIPEGDGRDGEIEPGSPVSLIFEGAVTDFAEAVKEHGPGEGVFRFALVEPGMRPPPQRWVADPVEGEEGVVEASDFPEWPQLTK